MTRGLLVAGLLGPAAFGAWKAIGLSLLWAGQSHLGVLNTLTRELPMELARGRRKEAGALGDVASAAAVVLAALPAFALVAWGSFGAGEHRAAWMLAAVVIPLQAFHFAQLEVLESERRFRRVARGEIVYAAMMLLLVVALVPAWGLIGVVVAAIGQRLVTVAYLRGGAGRSPRPALDPQRTLRMIRDGAAYWLAALSVLLHSTVDQILVLAALPTVQLGLYGIALAVTSPLRLWAHSLDTAVRPRTLAAWAQLRERDTPPPAAITSPRESDDVDALPPATRWFLLAQGTGYFLLPPAIALILPEFRSAGPAVGLLCVGAFTSLAGVGTGSVLLAADRRRALLGTYVAAALASLAVGSVAVGLGAGFLGATLGMVVGEGVRGGAGGWLAWRTLSGRRSGGFRAVWHLFAPGAWLLALVAVAETIPPTLGAVVRGLGLDVPWLGASLAAESLPVAAIKTVVFLAVGLPMLGVLRRRRERALEDRSLLGFRRLLRGRT